MAFEKRYNIRQYAVSGITLFLLYIIQYCGILPRIGGAAPFFLLLPAVVFAGMFMGEWNGAIFGLIAGIFTDAVSSSASGFNTLVFFIIGCVAGLFITYLFNNTAIAAILLTGASAFIYETSKFLIRYIVHGYENAAYHYTRYSLVAFVCTTLIAIPMYFIFKKLMKIANR